MRRALTQAPVLVAVIAAAGYVLAAPHTADLAAQYARADLFDRSGFVAYWSGWYAGIPSADYSLVTPPLLGVFGAVWLGALAIVVTGLLAPTLFRDSARPVLAGTLLVVAATLDVVSGRTTFAVGAVLGLAAFLAFERRHTVVAGGLAGLATLASPVAGFLILVVAVALVFVDRPHRRQAVSVAAGVVVALAVMAVLARGSARGGYEPFSRTSLLMAVGTSLVVVVAPVSRRVRGVALVTIGVFLVLFFVHSPLGANATRIAILLAVPAIVASARRPTSGGLGAPFVACVVLAALLPLAQLHNDLSDADHHDSSRSFVAGLQARLAVDPEIVDHRLEVVDTATHWPSTYLLPTVVLARGWERQTDEAQNPIFYGRAPLTAVTYRHFLDRNAVGEVAVARGVPLDYGSQAEAALIATGLPYLRPSWRDAHWQVYAVASPTPLVAAPARVVGTSDTGLTVDVPAAGSYEVRLRWSPYLVVDGGAVRRAKDDWVTLALDAPGEYKLHATWHLP